MKRNQLIIAVIVGFVILIAISYPLWIPLFVNQTVDEAFPFATMTDEQQSQFAALPEIQQNALIEMLDENAEMAEQTAIGMLEADIEMADDMPTEPTVLVQGSFTEIDAIHRGEGTATIYELPDGSNVLRFEEFRATNGPDLHVLLAKSTSPRSRDDLGEDYIDLGSLKGNVGNQNYDIPADIDISEYSTIVIYCMPFHVVFSTADLAPAT